MLRNSRPIKTRVLVEAAAVVQEQLVHEEEPRAPSSAARAKVHRVRPALAFVSDCTPVIIELAFKTTY